MPQDPRFFDKSAVEAWKRTGQPDVHPNMTTEAGKAFLRQSYANLIASQQRILTNTPWKEAWFMLHMVKAGRPAAGVDWFDDYIRAVNNIDPSIVVNHITFTYFHPVFINLPAQIAHLKNDMGTLPWVGSQYCEGLRDGNAVRARKAGFRGLICAPCHPTNGHRGLQPWMIEEIRKAARW